MITVLSQKPVRFTSNVCCRVRSSMCGPLTHSEKRGKWFACGQMELRVGGRMELEFHNSRLSPKFEPMPEEYEKYEGKSFFGPITGCDPPRVLSYTWGEAWGEDSEITFELTPRGADVIMVLTHRRLADRDAMVSVASGWHTHVGLLIDILNGHELSSFWSTDARLKDEYEKRIAPRRSRHDELSRVIRRDGRAHAVATAPAFRRRADHSSSATGAWLLRRGGSDRQFARSRTR